MKQLLLHPNVPGDSMMQPAALSRQSHRGTSASSSRPPTSPILPTGYERWGDGRPSRAGSTKRNATAVVMAIGTPGVPRASGNLWRTECEVVVKGGGGVIQPRLYYRHQISSRGRGGRTINANKHLESIREAGVKPPPTRPLKGPVICTHVIN